MSEDKRIEYIVDCKKILFDSRTNEVIFFTRHGVAITAEVPKDWGVTRVFQFMDSLISLDKHLI